MASIYDLKPAFQGLLRPLTRLPQVPVTPLFKHGLGKALPKGEWESRRSGDSRKRCSDNQPTGGDRHGERQYGRAGRLSSAAQD